MALGPTIIAKFIADTSKLESDVAGAGSKMSSTFGSSAKKLGTALGAGFVAKKVIDFGKASVNAAAEDAEAKDKLAKTMKNVTGATDDQIAANEEFIDGLSKSTAIADDELRPAMDNLIRGFGDAEKAQGALALATDISAGTGKDLGSVSEALMKAAHGQTTGLKKLGVEMKNADGSTKSLDEVMGDLSETFSGQAEQAAKGTAGQMRAASIAMDEFSESLGATVAPAVGDFAEILSVTLLPALETLVGNKPLLIGLGVVVVGLFTAWAIGAASAAIATLGAFAPFIGIGALVAGAVTIIVLNWDKIKAVVMTVFNWIVDHWPLLLTTLTGPFGAAVWIIKSHWDKIKGAAQAVWDWITGTWQTITGFITAPISAAVSTITDIWDEIKKMPQKALDWMKTTWAGIEKFIKAPIEAAKTIIVGLWDDIKGAATGAYDWIKGKFDAIARAIENVLRPIKTAVSSIVNAIKDPINALIRGWNRLAFTIPKISIPKVHIPGTNIDIGGGSFGGQTFHLPDIKELAGGGVLTRPTLFIGGEGGEPEIVAPESMLRQIMREEGAGASYTLNIYPRTVDVADIAYGFRRLELLAGVR